MDNIIKDLSHKIDPYNRLTSIFVIILPRTKRFPYSKWCDATYILFQEQLNSSFRFKFETL